MQNSCAYHSQCVAPKRTTTTIFLYNAYIRTQSWLCTATEGSVAYSKSLLQWNRTDDNCDIPKPQWTHYGANGALCTHVHSGTLLKELSALKATQECRGIYTNEVCAAYKGMRISVTHRCSAIHFILCSFDLANGKIATTCVLQPVLLDFDL